MKKQAQREKKGAETRKMCYNNPQQQMREKNGYECTENKLPERVGKTDKTP